MFRWRPASQSSLKCVAFFSFCPNPSDDNIVTTVYHVFFEYLYTTLLTKSDFITLVVFSYLSNVSYLFFLHNPCGFLLLHYFIRILLIPSLILPFLHIFSPFFRSICSFNQLLAAHASRNFKRVILTVH